MVAPTIIPDPPLLPPTPVPLTPCSSPAARMIHGRGKRGLMCYQQSILGFLHHTSPLIVLLLLLVPPSVSQSPYQKYLECSQPTEYPCGNQNYNVSFPFWLSQSNRPEYCSYPGYKLECFNDSMLLVDMGGPGDKSYQVKNIDYESQVLTIADPNFVGQSCPQAFTDATLDFTLFSYFDLRVVNLTLYSNCTSVDETTLHSFSCQKGQKWYYDWPDAPVLNGPAKCKPVGNITVNQTIADTLLASRQIRFLDFEDALQKGFGVRWSVGQDWCDGCIKSGGACGYDSQNPDAQTCYCSSNTSPSGSCKKGGIFKNKKIIIGLTTGVGVFLFVCLLFFLYLRWHKRMYPTNLFGKKNSFGAQTIEAAIGKYESLAPKRYKYSDVKKITKSFHDKLGQGGYGIVFKGSLRDGRLVAVKVLNDSKENGAEFINEVSSIGWTSHVNVVSLLGFCFEGSKRALIYEFMHNGSLEKYIYSESAKSTLGWENLYRIAIGIARGLEYLHHGCNSRMVHFDIKPQNILLDNEFCPKISDFGLAKLCSPKDSKLSMPVPRGTVGYIAPEVFSRNFGVVSSKSDVYSYGMVVLDMVGARNNKNTRVENTSENYFPDWIYSHLEHDGDLEAWGVTNETQEIAKKLIIVGLWCIQMLPRNRPSMSMVIEMLEGSIGDLKVPPKGYLSSTLESLFGTSSTWVSEDASGCM